ncbi:MAG: helix-turn-helix domain-containing protein [Thermosphaera sp.]
MDSSSEDLSGTALRIYVYLLESREPRGVRDVARALNVPVSSVFYHLKRLEELGVITRAREGYVIAKALPLEGYVILWRRLIPRLLIYSMFFLGIAIGQSYLIVAARRASPESIVALITSIAAFTILLVEGLIMRHRLRAG